MPKKKSGKKKSGGKKKKGSGKKGKSKAALATGPVSVSEQGLRSREYLRLQVEDLKNQVTRLRAANERLSGSRTAEEHVEQTAVEQLRAEVEYHRRENLRHVDALEDERRRWIEGTANLRERVETLTAEVEAAKATARARERDLREEIVALSQKLARLEEFRDQEHLIRRRLDDARLQLQQCEELHNEEKAALERKLVEQQAHMAASMDEKVALVARAFKSEADSRLDERARKLVDENARMSKRLAEMSTRVAGVVEANDSLRRQVYALKIELSVADDARKTLSATARKNIKVATALRDKHEAEEAAARDLEAELAEAREAEARLREEHEKHVAALQRTLEVTQRMRREEAGGAGADVGSVSDIGALVDRALADVESHFLERQAGDVTDADRHGAAKCHEAQMKTLRALRRSAPAVVEKMIAAMPPSRAAAAADKWHQSPGVSSVGVQAGPSAIATGSFGLSLTAPPAKGFPRHEPLHASGHAYERKPAGGLRSEVRVPAAIVASRRRHHRSTAHDFGLDVYALAAQVQAPPQPAGVTAARRRY